MESSTLIHRLVQENSLSQDQAVKALTIVFDFAKETYPVLRGNINQFLDSEIRNLQNSSEVEAGL